MAYPHERSYSPEAPQKPSTWTRFKQWFTHRECKYCGEQGPRKEMKDIPFDTWAHKSCNREAWAHAAEQRAQDEYEEMVYKEKRRLRAQKQAREELEKAGEL